MSQKAKFPHVVAIAASFSVMTLAACVSQPITQPSGDPSQTPSSTPSAVLPGDTASSTTLVSGIVYDDLQQRVSDATVTAKVLSGKGTFANGTDTLTTTTQVGAYSLNGVPAGATILVTVSKAGYTPREQTIVALSNPQANADANHLDFGMRGNNADAATAMSNKPEVQVMTPAADSLNADPEGAFTLTFSEPMNKSDVENNFAISVATDSPAGYTLTNGVVLPQQYVPGTDQFGGAAQPSGSNVIYGATNFVFAWSNNDQTVTITLRDHQKLPTDKDLTRVPQYAAGFTGPLRDATGAGIRSERFFRTSPAQLGRNGQRFGVAADTTAPRILSVTASNNSATASGNDQVRVQFTETMVLMPSNLGGGAAAIPNAATTPARSALTLSNYQYWAQNGKPASYGSGTAFGGSVQLWDGDLSRTTYAVNHNANTAFESGTVWVGVAGTVEDPAGNPIETQSGANIKSGNAV